MDRGACDRVANSCTITEWLRTHTHTHLGYLESCVASIKDWWYFLFIWITLFRTEIKSTFPPKLHLHVCFLLFVLICSSRLHFSFFFFISESLFLKKSTLFILSKSLFPLAFSSQLDSAKPDEIVSTYCLWILRYCTFLQNYVMKQIKPEAKEASCFVWICYLKNHSFKNWFLHFYNFPQLIHHTWTRLPM